jgi:hypothetical protein
MAEMTARDAKLVQYLNDAYGKEKELETSLQAHIGMASRKPYKNRLKDHLKETKNHARLVERRIKKLGGASTLQTVATKGGEAVSRGVALAKGPLHTVRGTGEAEIQHGAFRGGRGDRPLHGDRDARRYGRRQGDRPARAPDPARGGADGELPRQADPAAHEGGRPGRDPGLGAKRGHAAAPAADDEPALDERALDER